VNAFRPRDTSCCRARSSAERCLRYRPASGVDASRKWSPPRPIVRGNVALNGSSTLAGTSGAIVIGSKFTIILNNSSPHVPVAGTFNNAPEGGFVIIGGVSYGITYEGNNHNDVVLTRLGRFVFGTTTSPVDTADGYSKVSNLTVKTVGDSVGWSYIPLAVDGDSLLALVFGNTEDDNAFSPW